MRHLVDGLQAAEAKMREAGMPDPAVAVFRRKYREVAEGATGTLPSGELEPVSDVPRFEDLPEAPPDALADTVVIKLNGGLGTSMGLDRAKSLVQARDGRTFLELMIAQMRALRRRHGVGLPLLLLDSFRTHDDTLAATAGEDGVDGIVQHREPRLLADGLTPLEWPEEPIQEWCPPGHGDVYLALATSGALDRLLAEGYRHAFLSNGDNLGAAVEPRIAGWFAASGLPFAMEVVEGTEADRKGGHVARRSDGRLVLRETAQVPPGEEASFRDFRRWRFYNSNNLWVDLRAVRAALDRSPDLGLPLIVNRKSVGPHEVVQLETAMGAALGAFEGAGLLHIPRTRFAPVKTTDDLLALRSDAYTIDDEARVLPVSERLPYVELDPAHYKTVGKFESRFPHGAPSLVEAERLVIHGDVTFGAGVRVRGDVTLEGPAQIPDGAILDG
jgi:UTP--glucose-1-phosphate uridylyltransferase